MKVKKKIRNFAEPLLDNSPVEYLLWMIFLVVVIYEEGWVALIVVPLAVTIGLLIYQFVMRLVKYL